MARNYKQGVFTPKHPEKYVGNVDNIVYRSSWELQVFGFLDRNPKILRWASEEIAIPYFDRATNKLRTYYPDMWIEYMNKDGKVIKEVIEVKPISQTKLPNKRHKHYLSETLTYITNKCKWEAAKQWCATRNMKFRVLTENSIFK